MKIAVDARELAGRPTGVGRYLQALLREWAAAAEAASHRFILYSPARVPVPPGLDAELRVLAGPAGTWWEQVRLPGALSADRPDVLFAPGYSAPLRAQVPVTLTVHDVSFYAHPPWFGWRERFRRQWTTRFAARRARVILADSAFSRTEIVRWLGVPPERVRVIRLGVDPPWAAPVVPGQREGDAERLVLFAGSVFNRRRVPDLIAAFARVAATDPAVRLEIVGEDRTHPAQDLTGLAWQSGAGERIALRSYVTDAELASLYARARVFAFLSEYEGFGLTPLEALACGVPPVVLDTPIAREVYQRAALYVQPGDIEGTAEALRTLLDDHTARDGLLAEAPAVLGQYAWTRTARETLAAIVEAGGGAG